MPATPPPPHADPQPTTDADPPAGARDMARWAWQHTAGQGAFTRVLARYRPAICPFELVVQQVPRASRVLDLGCGRGLLLSWLHDQGRVAQGLGIDRSPTAIDEANAFAQRIGAQDDLAFAPADVHQDWPDLDANVITLIDVMHHLRRDQRQPLIQRIAETLQPGGRFVYKDMATSPLPHRIANRCHDLVLARQWIREEPVGRVEAWASDAGLRLTHAQDARRLWYSHQLRVFEKPTTPD